MCEHVAGETGLRRLTGRIAGRQVTKQHPSILGRHRCSVQERLDADATAILNALYNEEGISEADNMRILCLFRMDFENRTDDGTRR